MTDELVADAGDEALAPVPQIPAEPPSEMVLSLRKPIAGVDGPITSLSLREPVVFELIERDKAPDAERGLLGISMVSGIPESFLRKLTARDYFAATEYIARFLARPRPTGEPAETFDMPLRKPLTPLDGSPTITALPLHEPSAGELITMAAKTGLEGDVAALSQISGIPVVTLRQLCARDFIDGALYLDSFFPAAPTDGAQP
jgi:hypothetical protein